jgi:phage baseplate assembly protein gpV
VTDNADPDALHRVQIAKIGEEDGTTDWIPVITPYSGSEAGSSLLPDVDDQVLVVSFDSKGIKKAVIGSIWSNEANPPKTEENSGADLNADGENSLRFFKSRAGSLFIFDDTEGAEKIQLISSDGKSRLEISVADELLSLTTDNDLTMGAKGAISIQAEELSIELEKQVDVSMEEYQVSSEKAFDMEADKDMGFTGSGISLN